MARCNYRQQSIFRDVFDAKKDFGQYSAPYEMPEELQLIFDPVGFYFFHKDVVYKILSEVQQYNNRRYNLRDILREMDLIWRFNSVQRIILNEPDHNVSKRVNELIRITRQKLNLDARVENLVTGDILKHWEFQVPAMNPALPLEKLSNIRQLTTPHIDSQVSVAPFNHVRKFNRKLYLHH